MRLVLIYVVAVVQVLTSINAFVVLQPSTSRRVVKQDHHLNQLHPSATPSTNNRAASTLIRTRSSNNNNNDSPFGGLRLLEWANKAVPQSSIVKGARFSWNLAWKTLMAELAPQSKDGGYVRPHYGFRSFPLPGHQELPLEAGRYHIYVGNACPWCHRITLAHIIRGLTQDQVSYSYALDDPEKASRGGWAFVQPNFIDPIFGCKDLREVYELCSPGYKGRCTAPVMIDKKTRKIINNESSDLIRILNHLSPADPAKEVIDLYPRDLQVEIDRINLLTYTHINNGVYRCGFATSQSAYEKAAQDVFTGLDEVEALLSSRRYLAGSIITEADLRLLPTILRFDAVYATLFRCTSKRISDYPNLMQWTREMYQLPGVKGTLDLPGLIRSYYVQLFPLNPSGIYPIGPTEEDLRLMEPHDRAQRFPVESMYRVREQVDR